MARNAHQARKEKKQLRWRIAAFLVLHLLIGLHLLLWYVYDWQVIGAIDMQELFRNFIEKNVLTAGAVFFLALIGLTLIWGRLFCGWMCHIGQVYDLLAAFYARIGVKMRAFPLRLGPLMAFFVLVWYFLWEAVVHRSTTAEPPAVVDMGLTEPWELLPGWINGSITLGLVLFILPLFLGRRAFCRNLCPWGVVLGAVNRFSPLKVRRTGDCTMCGQCSSACPMDIDVSRVINVNFHVGELSCTNCLQCVASCPVDALSFSLPKKENRKQQKLPFLSPLPYPAWSLELGFWAMVLAVGLTYSELYGMGIFMAYTIGLLIARASIWAFQNVRKRGFASRLVPAVLSLLLVWGIVAKDGMAARDFQVGVGALRAGDLRAAQNHLERCDRLFWVTPDTLLLNLNQIYDRTGQFQKKKQNADRFNKRQRARGRL